MSSSPSSKLASAKSGVRRGRDRRPDPNVGQTILSVKAQRDFKRMLVFGLRSLSDLCSVNNRQYVDNSYTCIEEDLLLEFDQILTRHENDPDIVGLTSKILVGICRSFLTEPDDHLKSQAVDQGITKVLTSLLVQSLTTHAPLATWDQLQSVATDLSKAGVTVCTEEGIAEAIKALGDNNINATQAQTFCSYLSGGLTPDMTDKIVAAGAPSHLLETAQRIALRSPNDRKALQLALNATEFLTKLPMDKQSNDERTITAIISLMDIHHGSSQYTQLGSNVLASLIGPDKLQDVLNKISRGGAESVAALGLLTALSYVPSFATDWAKQGGNKPLVNVLKGAVSKIDLSDVQQMNALKGAAQMVATIAADDATHCQDLKERGVAACLIEILARVGAKSTASKEHEDLVTACLKALNILCERDLDTGTLLVQNKQALKICVESVEKGGTRGDNAISLLGEVAVLAAPQTSMVRKELLALNVDTKLLKALESQEGIQGGAAFKLLTGLLDSQVPPAWASGVLKGIRGLQSTDLAGGEAAILLLTRMSALDTAKSANLTDGILDLCLKFSQTSSNITSQCTKLLSQTASEDDLARAVNTVVKLSSSPKGHVDELMTNFATINGLVNIDRLRDRASELKIEDSLIKAANHISAASPFVSQQQLLTACFGCLATTQKLVPGNTASISMKLITMSLSPGMKAAVQFEASSDDNSLLECLRCVQAVLQGDSFDDNDGGVKVLEALGSVMRKYPDSRKVLAMALDAMATLLDAKTADLSKEFIKMGTAKQVISLLQKAAVHEELQRNGLKCLLNIAQRSNDSSEALRAAGTMEVVRAANRGYGNKPDIVKMCMSLTRLLTPVEEARREVSEHIGHLNTASRNRDIVTGKKALASLCDLTQAADAAKHAARNGVGDAVGTFFEAMGAVKTAGGSSEMEVCSKDAVGIMKNTAAVGRPHSSLLLKNGALNLLKTIATEAKNNSSTTELSKEVFKSALDAGRILLANERNPLYAPGAMEFNKYLMEVMPDVMQNDPQCIPTLVATMGLLAGPQTVKDPSFKLGVQEMINSLNKATSEESRNYALSCIVQMFGNAGRDGQIGKELVQLFADCGGCEALLKVVEQFSTEEPVNADLACSGLQLVAAISSDHGALLRKAVGKNPLALQKACKAFGRNLGTTRDDSVAMVSTISLLTAMTTRMDRTDLENTGLLEVVQDLMGSHSNSRQLQAAVGDFLVNFGAEDWILKYFSKVIQLLTEKPNGYKTELIEVLTKLEIFIPCSTDNVEQTYKDAPQAMLLLADYLESCKGDAEALSSITLVARRLCQRFDVRVEDGSPRAAPEFGVRCMIPRMMNAMIEMIHKKDPSSLVRRTRSFLRDSYEVLDMMCAYPDTFAILKPRVLESGFLKSTWEVFERYCKDAEVAEAVIRFIGHFAADEQCMAEIERTRNENEGLREMGKDTESTIMTTVWGLRRSPGAVREGLDAIGNVVARKGGNSDMIKNKGCAEKVKQLAEGSIEGANGYAKMVRRLMSVSETEGVQDLVDDALGLIIRRWMASKDNPDIKDETKQDIVRELAGVAAMFAERGRFQDLKQHKISSVLAEAVKTLPPRGDVVKSITRCLDAMSENAELRDGVVTKGIPAIVAECTMILQTDPEAAEEALKLIYRLISEDDEACNFMRDLNGLRETLEGIVILANDQKDLETKERLLTLVNQIRRLLDQAQPGQLTLEEVHRRWTLRKEDGELLDLSDNQVLIKEFLFVIGKTGELGRSGGQLEETENISTINGREFSFGCLNFGLLHDYPDNVPRCLGNSEDGSSEVPPPQYFMQAMARLSDNELVQYIVNGTLRGLYTGAAATAYGSTERAPLVVCQMVQKGMAWRMDNDPMRKEAFLIKRLDFMEKICFKRSFYDGTEALNLLSKIWDDVDQKAYSLGVLRQLVRVLRAMINENWCDDLIKKRIPERLLERIENVESPHDLLPDLLFCIGTMASVPKLKNLLGELEAIEKVTDLLKRCEKLQKKNVDCSRTQQNACLALGNLVLGHGPNSNAFGNAKGPDLVIRVMKSSMTGRIDYDLANAASILMCNLSFKRDDFKEHLGSRGAPEAILMTIHNYDGLASDSAYRCLNSMFKGVTNLALIPSNVQRFLDSEISKALESFYANSASTPDELVHVSLRTLSNLTLENTTAFMEQFGGLVPALLRLLEEKPRTDPDMLSFLFETFTSLCRHPDNRDLFISSRGVEIITGYLNSVKHERVYEQGLALFAVLASDKRAVEDMINSGFCNFVLGILDDCEELSAELVIGGLKVLRRLVCDRNAARAFVESSPMPLLTDVLCAAASQANVDAVSACTATEALRILLQLLHLHPAPCGGDRDEAAEVVTQPEWTADFGGTDRTKSFSRLFKSNRMSTRDVKALERELENDVDGGDATPENDKTSTDGSPVALDSPERKASETQNGDEVQTVLYKPRGVRAYENIGLDARAAVCIARALFLMLVEQESETLRLDKLTRFAMVYLAYATAEKVDGVNQAFTEEQSDLGILVTKTFGRMKEQRCDAKKHLVFEGTEYLANTLCLITSDDIKALANTDSAMKALRSCGAALHPKKEQLLKRKVEELYALLSMEGSELKPSLFYPLTTYEVPLDAEEFTTDKYPNGVQDLPTDIRKKLRRGGKGLVSVIDEAGRPAFANFYWKSSTDLTSLRYMNDRKAQNYDFEIPLSRVRKLERGAHSTSLYRQHGKALKLRSGCVVAVTVSPCPQHPNGAEMIVQLPTRFHAKKFHTRLFEWQVAASV